MKYDQEGQKKGERELIVLHFSLEENKINKGLDQKEIESDIDLDDGISQKVPFSHSCQDNLNIRTVCFLANFVMSFT